MEIPEGMAKELGAWNNGRGIGLEDWIGCEGRFALAVGYAAAFWPAIHLAEGYLITSDDGPPDPEHILTWEHGEGATRDGVEAVCNHLHIVDLHAVGCADASSDKLEALGEVLREMWAAKLAMQFPDRPCRVAFRHPDDPMDLEGYELSFWQIANEGVPCRP